MEGSNPRGGGEGSNLVLTYLVTRFMEGVLLVKYTKGVPFLSEMVYIER